MTAKTLLFVSVSRLPRPGDSEELRDIVEKGRARNRALGVSSTLIAARGRLAAVLDGQGPSLDTLMRSIAADPRHERLTVALRQDSSVDAPRRPGMELVYRGESLYIARAIDPLLEAGEPRRDQARLAAQLLFLIRELAKRSEE